MNHFFNELNLNYKFWLLITSKKNQEEAKEILILQLSNQYLKHTCISFAISRDIIANNSHAHGLPAFSFFVSPRLSVTKILLPAFILEARRLPSIPVEFDVRIYSLSFDDLARQFHAPARFRPRWSKLYEIFDNRWDGFLFSSFNLALYIDKRAIPVCVG